MGVEITMFANCTPDKSVEIYRNNGKELRKIVLQPGDTFKTIIFKGESLSISEIDSTLIKEKSC